MDVLPTAIADIKLLKPCRFDDWRGWFVEIWQERRFLDAGISGLFVQDNMALSTSIGTVRGLHFQRPPAAQAKLIVVVTGRILDVAVDIRQGSPTFGQHVAAEISAEGGEQLWIPEGFAHGYCTLAPETRVFYKVTAFYDAAAEGGIRFDDPALGIGWPVDATAARMSEKDRNLPALADLPTAFIHGAAG